MFIDFPRGIMPTEEDQESNISGHEDVEFYRGQTWLGCNPTGISNHVSSSGTFCASLRLRSIVRDLAGQDLLQCGMVLGRTPSAECLKLYVATAAYTTDPVSLQKFRRSCDISLHLGDRTTELSFLGSAQESSYIAACFVTGLSLSDLTWEQLVWIQHSREAGYSCREFFWAASAISIPTI